MQEWIQNDRRFDHYDPSASPNGSTHQNNGAVLELDDPQSKRRRATPLRSASVNCPGKARKPTGNTVTTKEDPRQGQGSQRELKMAARI